MPNEASGADYREACRAWRGGDLESLYATCDAARHEAVDAISAHAQALADARLPLDAELADVESLIARDRELQAELGALGCLHGSEREQTAKRMIDKVHLLLLARVPALVAQVRELQARIAEGDDHAE